MLVFSATNSYRNTSIEAGIEAIGQLADKHNFKVMFTEDSTLINSSTIDTMQVLLFLSTSGNVLDTDGKGAVEVFIANGGCFVGVHAASAMEYEWPWYGRLVGSYFQNHPAIQEARLSVLDSSHPSTQSLPSTFLWTDEWYNFQTPFPENLQVLITVDEGSYEGGTMGAMHPVAWCHEFENSRAFYTSLGHADEAFRDKDFMAHLWGGIYWAARLED